MGINPPLEDDVSCLCVLPDSRRRRRRHGCSVARVVHVIIITITCMCQFRPGGQSPALLPHHHKCLRLRGSKDVTFRFQVSAELTLPVEFCLVVISEHRRNFLDQLLERTCCCTSVAQQAASLLLTHAPWFRAPAVLPFYFHRLFNLKNVPLYQFFALYL